MTEGEYRELLAQLDRVIVQQEDEARTSQQRKRAERLAEAYQDIKAIAEEQR